MDRQGCLVEWIIGFDEMVTSFEMDLAQDTFIECCKKYNSPYDNKVTADHIHNQVEFRSVFKVTSQQTKEIREWLSSVDLHNDGWKTKFVFVTAVCLLTPSEKAKLSR